MANPYRFLEKNLMESKGTKHLFFVTLTDLFGNHTFLSFRRLPVRELMKLVGLHVWCHHHHTHFQSYPGSRCWSRSPKSNHHL